MDRTEIYGVDLTSPVTPIIVRDAIIRCFKEAHATELEELRNYMDEDSKLSFEKIKEIDVTILVKSIFSDINADFDNPTKDDLQKAIEKLAEYAKNFRSKDVVQKHSDEIMILINKLS